MLYIIDILIIMIIKTKVFWEMLLLILGIITLKLVFTRNCSCLSKICEIYQSCGTHGSKSTETKVFTLGINVIQLLWLRSYGFMV